MILEALRLALLDAGVVIVTTYDYSAYPVHKRVAGQYMQVLQQMDVIGSYIVVPQHEAKCIVTPYKFLGLIPVSVFEWCDRAFPDMITLLLKQHKAWDQICKRTKMRSRFCSTSCSCRKESKL